MSKFAAIMLIGAVAYLLATASLAAAKGPPGKVVISGGNLTSEVVLEKSDLAPITGTGVGSYFDFQSFAGPGTPYSHETQILGETPYVVTIFEIDEGNHNQLQQFMSERYFPANSQHPGLLAQEGKLWKLQPAFGALLDGRIKSALSPANLPSSGGPPDTTTNTWAYAIAVGALLLLGSAAAVAHARRR